MVVALVAGLLLTGIAGWFFVTSVGTVLNLLAVLSAGAVGIGLFYNLYQMRPLDLSEVSSILTYSSVGVASGFVVFRVLQHLVSAVSFGVALVAGLLVVASVVLSPQIVAGVLKSLFDFILAFVNDE